jgi:hypothetical protein
MADLPYRSIFCSQMSYDTTTTGGKSMNVNGAQRLVIRTTGNCYIDFDQPVSVSQSYLIASANTSDTVIELTGGTISKIYALGQGGSGTIYVIAITN